MLSGGTGTSRRGRVHGGAVGARAEARRRWALEERVWKTGPSLCLTPGEGGTGGSGHQGDGMGRRRRRSVARQDCLAVNPTL